MLILSADSACDICLDPYSNDGGKAPASLGCGHAFCRSCLHTLATRVCPVCRRPFSVTDDMRKLHIDLESRFSQEITDQERRALEACRSGDLLLMEGEALGIEQWLQSQSPSFRCSLSTVVALVRLLMEATSQLHEALERSQTDEQTLRMRQELDSMKAAADRRRLQQETEALRVGMVRQREHLSYLESELEKARGHSAAGARVPTIVTPVKTRPALPRPPTTPAPLQPSNYSPPVPPPPRVVSEAPISRPTKSPRPPTPMKTTLYSAPLVDSIKTTIILTPPATTESSRPTTPTKSIPKTVLLMDSNLSTFKLNPPVRHISRTSLHGPRERNSASEPVPRESSRPQGAAPSAFAPVKRPSLRSVESLESVRSSPLESRRTFLEPVRSSPLESRRTSLPSSSPYSYDASTRRQRYSAQPTSWRPVGGTLESSQENKSPVVEEWDSSALAYLHSVESHESTPARPTRSQPPPIVDSPSLSRKRALRRHPRDALL